MAKVKFNYSKLKGLIVEKYDTMSCFADSLGVAIQTISAKLNNKQAITKNDIIVWSNMLGIEVNDIGLYFFTPEV